MNDKEAGYIYVNENCWRAITHLTRGTGQEWRDRIRDAVLDAHRPSDTEYFTQWMSPDTLEAWRDCMPEKPFDELTDSEVTKVAEHLTRFLFNYQRDWGLRDAQNHQIKT